MEAGSLPLPQSCSDLSTNTLRWVLDTGLFFILPQTFRIIIITYLIEEIKAGDVLLHHNLSWLTHST